MTTNSYVPAADGKFDLFANNFVSTIKADPTTFDMTTESITELESLLTEWDDAYFGSQAKRDEALAAVTEKEQNRVELEKRIRHAAKLIQANTNISNEARRKAGLPVHSETRKPVPAPSTFPIAFVEQKAALQHDLRWVDSATPTRRARPAVASGCEVYVYIGASLPTDFDAFKFIGISSKSPRRLDFDQADCGQTAFYRLRWINNKGQTGPWSEVVSATIFG
ncbi:hypothetical protein [Mariniblastus fucicola]|uniref:Uncharacterized protein n=1 Tax=Mariniblastus fucicola TaxID=980251 RepID=A0A5B9PG81_9BACT|nr:hypothetical protein [Mariniblastus fucicola]QEG23772.1 hypothetical protein MFFC18_36740 [Mariniblastus fucicola]